MKGWTWGNGATYNRGFDQDGRVAAYTLGTQSFSVGYDPASRITSIAEAGNPANTNTYAYDNLDRLTGAILPATTNYSYAYDAVGNRSSKVTGGNTDTYEYFPTSNRLSKITPVSGPVKTYTYDAVGNITGDGTSSYLHDTRGRLVQANVAGVASVRHYNGLGQRTYRFFSSAPDFVIISAYDEAGQPIGQYTIDTTTGGVNGHEVVYLEAIPVAIAAFDDPPGAGNTVGFGPFYLHPDHLDTPRLVTDVANQVLWRWDHGEPFGNSPANEDPSGLGFFGINYRFPGQYLDKASNTHYNYFRDYGPAEGRYIQSDPIGLLGGINTYVYALNNPLSFTDPDGLQVPQTRNREDPRPGRERPDPRQTTPADPQSKAMIEQKAACMADCLKDYERKTQQYCTVATIIFTIGGTAAGGPGAGLVGGVACAVGCPPLTAAVIDPVSTCQLRCFR